jgi:hypothetical protein
VAVIQVFLFFGNLANCPIWQALQCGRLLEISQASPTSKSKLPNTWVRLLTHTRARAQFLRVILFPFRHEAAMRSPIRSSNEVTKSAAAWEMPMKPVGRDSAAVGAKKSNYIIKSPCHAKNKWQTIRPNHHAPRPTLLWRLEAVSSLQLSLPFHGAKQISWCKCNWKTRQWKISG